MLGLVLVFLGAQEEEAGMGVLFVPNLQRQSC
jgi:hypothetical protein